MINKYTRPLICKVSSEKEWKSVFGAGIISDTHIKYKNNKNGQFIEWIIEIVNIRKYGTKSSIIIGISSDLLGESKETNFTDNINGFGFDNLGQIYHHNQNKEKNEELNLALFKQYKLDIICKSW